MRDPILRVISAFKRLNSRDLRILNAIERGMAFHEIVPVERIASLSGMNLGVVLVHLSKLHKLGLIWRNIGPYVGYVLTTAGYDCLALNALVKAGIIEALGHKLGVGKESDVYDALSPAGSRLAVKFHRLGRISFRQTRRYRAFIGERRHISWLYQSRLAAEREYEALNLVFAKGVHVPRPIGHNRHVVVTSLIEGIQLVRLKELPDPEGLLLSILEDIKIAYREAGVIHGDLSEYNIIVHIGDEQSYVIIDWPQWVSSIHPSSDMLLRRDIRNVLNFFRRRFGIKLDVDRVLDYVKSK